MSAVQAVSHLAMSATYKSPSTAETFQYNQQSTPGPASIADTTRYLGQLGTDLNRLQADVNAFLTRRMEEDKRDVNQESAGGSQIVDDDKEEANYGEEVENED